MGLRVNFNAFLPEPLTPAQAATWEVIEAGSRVVKLCDAGIEEARRDMRAQREAADIARGSRAEVERVAEQLKHGG